MRNEDPSQGGLAFRDTRDNAVDLDLELEDDVEVPAVEQSWPGRRSGVVPIQWEARNRDGTRRRRTAEAGAREQPGPSPETLSSARAALKQVGKDRPRDSRLTDSLRARRALEDMRASGSPLGADLASSYASLLSVDLSDVRIHVGGAPGQLATSLGARAFAAGNQIVFADGAFDPAQRVGMHILAHELVHVAQAKRGGGDMLAASAEEGPSTSAVEEEAESGARALLAGRPFQVAARSSLPAVSFYNDGPDGGAPPGGAPPAPTGSPSAPPAPAGSAPPAPAGSAPPAPAGSAPPAPAGSAPPAPAGSAPPAPAGSAPPAPAGSAPPAPAGGPAAPGAQGGTALPAGVTAAPATDPNANPGSTANDNYKFTKSGKVADLMNERADPTTKAAFERYLGASDAVRLGSLQYSFNPSSFWRNVLQGFVPTDNFKEHWNQIATNNPYASGKGALAGLQTFIEGARAIIRLIGDVVVVLGTIASAVALVAAIIGVCGAAPALAVAAVAGEIALALQVVKIALDCIDVVIGFFQLAILALRLRLSDDPGERAQIVQLMKKEGADFSANIVQIGFEVVACVVGLGIGSLIGGTAVAEQLTNAFKSLTNPVARFAAVSAETVAGAAGKAAVAFAKSEAVTVAKETVAAGTAAAAKGFEAFVLVDHAALVSAVQLLDKNKATFEVAEKFSKQCVSATRGVASNVIAVPPGMFFSVAQGGVKIAAALPGTGGPSGGAGATPKTPEIKISLKHVLRWPKLLEDMSSRRKDVHDAQTRMKGFYDLARADVSDAARAQVDAAFGVVEQRNTRMRAEAMAKKDAAAHGAEQAQTAADKTQAAEEPKKKGDATQDQTKGHLDKAGSKGDEASSGANAKKEDKGLLEKAWDATGGWVLGKIFDGIAAFQKFIGDGMTSLFLWIGGAKANDIDLAGIGNDFKKDKDRDLKAEKEAAEAAAATDIIGKETAKLRENKSKSDQNAIQGLADTMRWINALDDVDQALAKEIAASEDYVNKAAEEIERELAVKKDNSNITPAYIQPIVTASAAFADAASHGEGDFNTGGSQKVTELETALNTFPQGDYAKGMADARKLLQDCTTQVRFGSDSATFAANYWRDKAQAAVGTTNYDGVQTYASCLESDISDYSGGLSKAKAFFLTSIEAIGARYTAAVRAVVNEADKGPAAGAPAPGNSAAPPAPGGSAAPPAPGGSAAPPAPSGSAPPAPSGSAPPAPSGSAPPAPGGSAAPPAPSGSAPPAPGGSAAPPAPSGSAPPPPAPH